MPIPPSQRPNPTPLQRDVENASQQYGSGDIGVSQSGGGLQITDGSPRAIWAVINAQPNDLINAYGYTRVDDGTGDGTYPVLDGTTEEGDGDVFGGDLIAWEVNGRLDVPIDGTVRVQLTPNRMGPGFTFIYPVPAEVSGSCSGSIAACCGPGPDIFPDSESDPTDTAYDNYVQTDTKCIDGTLLVLREKHRMVWSADICRPIDDYYAPELTEAGCCDCPSGSDSGSTPTVPCIPYDLLCVTYSGGTGVCACINGLTATLTLTTGSIENITWQGTINTTPIALTCTGGVWTMSHLEPETASSCEVEGGAGEAFYPPSLPFTISLTGMTINGTECGTITATISLGACEEASGSTSTCGFCDTYVVQEWTELYTGIVHPAETMHRNTTAYPGVACCWQSANYTMFTARNGFVLYNSQDIQLAPCAWNSPASNPDDTPSWDGNGCATFTGTTIGSCQDVTVCCGDSGSESGSQVAPECCVVTTETFVEGGADCASATELVPGAYWALTPVSETWFHFSLPSTTRLSCKIEWDTNPDDTECYAGVTANYYYSDFSSCDSLGLYATFVGSGGCLALLGPAGGGYADIWLKITAPLPGVCYKITVYDNDACTP